MYLTFRLLFLAGWLGAAFAAIACTPTTQPPPARVPPAYKENPY